MTDALEKIQNLIEPVLERAGYELVDLEYRRGPKQDLLRVLMDKAGRTSYAPPARGADGTMDASASIDVSDCARMSRELSHLMDVEELLTHATTFEVSSPGVNRPLRRQDHFERAVGLKVRIKTRVPVANETFFIAPLIAADDEGITLTVGDGEVVIPYRHIRKANIEFEF